MHLAPLASDINRGAASVRPASRPTSRTARARMSSPVRDRSRGFGRLARSAAQHHCPHALEQVARRLAALAKDFDRGPPSAGFSIQYFTHFGDKSPPRHFISGRAVFHSSSVALSSNFSARIRSLIWNHTLGSNFIPARDHRYRAGTAVCVFQLVTEVFMGLPDRLGRMLPAADQATIA